MPASDTALVNAKNIFTSASSSCRSRADTNCANRLQWPGGSSDLGPSAQYSAITFCLSVSPTCTSMRCCAWAAYSALSTTAGGPARNWLAEVNANGITSGQQAAIKPGVTTAPLPSVNVSGCQVLGAGIDASGVGWLTTAGRFFGW